MNEVALIEHTSRILEVAAADCPVATDALAATAQALAALIVVTSRTEGTPFNDLLKSTLVSVASFAMDRRDHSELTEDAASRAA